MFINGYLIWQDILDDKESKEVAEVYQKLFEVGLLAFFAICTSSSRTFILVLRQKEVHEIRCFLDTETVT